MAIPDITPLTDEELNELLRTAAQERTRRIEAKTAALKVENFTRSYVAAGGDPAVLEGAVLRGKTYESPSREPKPDQAGTMTPSSRK